jgi:Acetyltransferase (GNAT) domain
MQDDASIQYLSNRQIDKHKWDQCIANASNGLIYGYSFYLDHMARNWDAIVLSKDPLPGNTYDAVLPLPWNSKYGIRYIYQPFLTAQLGIFGTHISNELTTSMILSIPTSFRLIEMPLNSANHPSLPAKACVNRSNYVLDLERPYVDLEKIYNDNTRRNLRKAAQSGCIVAKNIAVDEVIRLAVSQMKKYDKQANENVERFRDLFQQLQAKNMTVTYGIELNGKLVSSAIFFYSHHRAYYILVGNHPDGRGVGASHALIDSFVKDHAGKKMILDFEGSDIPTLASFYSGFGAVLETYPALKINRLPLLVRWMK